MFWRRDRTVSIIGNKGIGKEERTGHSPYHSISKGADHVIEGIESWLSIITTPVAMNSCKAGSKDRGGLYITDKNGIHRGTSWSRP
jgi:hypothetical protein